MIDTRYAILLIWGGGALVLGSVVLWKRWKRFRVHRNDRRQGVRVEVRRDVISGFALFLTAAGSAVATAMVLFGEAGSGPRTFATAVALGAFLGALMVMASEEDTDGQAGDRRVNR